MLTINNLIICNPYERPTEHWSYNRLKKEFDLIPERRSAGYLVASQASQTFDDPGEFIELRLVNKIRERLDIWREKDYPNTTGITKQLLRFWHNELVRGNRFFFCQLEAIETLIWLTEASDAEKQGIVIPSDGGPFQRICAKMATGTGKTVVMAMLIAWQVLNKVTYPQDPRFSKNILIMAPGLTVKSRLAVLYPDVDNNYYHFFSIIPSAFYERFRQAKIVIRNWHTLMPLEDAKRSVVKKGQESDEAFSKRILNHNLKNILVINDEAHHAWRAKDTDVKATTKEKEEATRWVEGLDKIHRARDILTCFDFSATPFIPTGKRVEEESLYKWIVSDFSLNDAIESGLVKTPRIVIKDDSNEFDEDYRSKFYRIYANDEVKPDLNRRSKPDEPLPDLVKNAYYLLEKDWTDVKNLWDNSCKDNSPCVPPVMITVCNRTETAARIMHFFKKDQLSTSKFSDPKHLLHIDSRVLRQAEEKDDVPENDGTDSLTADKMAEGLRQKVDTVGQTGKPGEQIRNIVAVQMLSEGWDAKTVTHIMGLRAFTSQLLCEQVVGRGLRRRSYEINRDTGLFDPEYVNIFGVPFAFLPHEGGVDNPPKPPAPTTRIMPDHEKREHEIKWPNIDRIETILTTRLTVDWSKVKPLRINSDKISTTVGVAPILEGKPNVDGMSDIEIDELSESLRMQQIIFIAARDIYNETVHNWRGSKGFLISQIIKIVGEFVESDKIDIVDVPKEEEVKRRMTVIMNIQKIVSHIFALLKSNNMEERRLIFNTSKPTKSTGDMQPWYTKKPCDRAEKSHINFAVYDSRPEKSAADDLDRNKRVISWVKNNHMGFGIKYIYGGVVHDYWPDYLVRLENGINLVLEIKGRYTDQDKEKRKALQEWVDAVNEDGGFGTWSCDVAFAPSKVNSIIAKHAKSDISARISAKCPSCNKKAVSRQQVQDRFGFRNMDGIMRPQSWCRACRKEQSVSARLRSK